MENGSTHKLKSEDGTMVLTRPAAHAVGSHPIDVPRPPCIRGDPGCAMLCGQNTGVAVYDSRSESCAINSVAMQAHWHARVWNHDMCVVLDHCWLDERGEWDGTVLP